VTVQTLKIFDNTSNFIRVIQHELAHTIAIDKIHLYFVCIFN